MPLPSYATQKPPWMKGMMKVLYVLIIAGDLLVLANSLTALGAATHVGWVEYQRGAWSTADWAYIVVLAALGLSLAAASVLGTVYCIWKKKWGWSLFWATFPLIVIVVLLGVLFFQ